MPPPAMPSADIVFDTLFAYQRSAALNRHSTVVRRYVDFDCGVWTKLNSPERAEFDGCVAVRSRRDGVPVRYRGPISYYVAIYLNFADRDACADYGSSDLFAPIILKRIRSRVGREIRRGEGAKRKHGRDCDGQ